MALSISVYRNADPRYWGCTNDGVSSRFQELLVVNVEGPSNPNGHMAPVLLQSHTLGCLRLVPAHWDPLTGTWKQSMQPMMGGNYGATSDSRFSQACERLLGHRFYGAVPIHDRYE